MKQILKQLNACEESIEWVGDRTIEEAVNECPRGDWMLWLFNKLHPDDLQLLTLAKGHCANTVRHLMKDERSINAVDIAIAFGEGKATLEQLNSAAVAAAAYDYAYAASDPAYTAAYAAASAAYAAAAAAYAASDYAATAYTSAYAYAAKIENQKQTADICRKYLGSKLIEGLNNLKKITI